MSFENIPPQGRRHPLDMPPLETDEHEERIEKHTYPLDSEITVDILVKKFEPEHTEAREDRKRSRAVIYIAGHSMTAENGSVANICRAYADVASLKTYAISSSSREQGALWGPESNDFLYEEARAISMFIEKKGIEEVTIVGHSEGGDKAINVAAILQEEVPGVAVHGLILLASAGLYKQTQETIGKLPGHIANAGREDEDPAVAKRREQATQDIRLNNFQDAMQWFLTPQRTPIQIEEVTRKNPRMADVACPIVVFFGKDDPVANLAGIVSPRAEKRVRKKLGEISGVNNKTVAARAEIARKIFPLSSGVRIYVAEKTPDHLFPIVEPKHVAETSFGILERLHRGDTVH